MPYSLIVVLGLMLVILDGKDKNKHTRILMYSIFIFMILSMVVIGGLREDAGFDFSSYLRIFKGIPKLSSDFISITRARHGEIGFKLLVGLIKSLGFMRVQVLFTVTIIISILLITKSLKQYTPYYYIGFFLYTTMYFFGRDMGQIRQGISTAVCFFSIKFIKERKKVLFFITIAIAASLHSSAIILLPFYFISTKEIKTKTYIIILLIGTIIVNIDWLRGNITYIENILSFELPYIDSKYGQAITSIFSMQYVRRLQPAILILIGNRKLRSKFEYFTPVANLYIFGVFLSLVFHEVAIYVERLFVPLLFVEILIYGYFIDYFSNRYTKLFYKFILIGYAVLYFANLMISKLEVFFPYKNILFN